MEPPRVVRLLALAEEFRALIEAGEVRNQADIARLKGLTRARVTQILNLLKLAPEIQDYIRALPNEAPRNRVTEKKVRSLTGRGHEKQLREARSILHGFQPPTRQSA